MTPPDKALVAFAHETLVCVELEGLGWARLPCGVRADDVLRRALWYDADTGAGIWTWEGTVLIDGTLVGTFRPPTAADDWESLRASFAAPRKP